MTHSSDDAQKVAELNSIFAGLNDRGKDSALTILRALSFAQAVMYTEPGREAEGRMLQTACESRPHFEKIAETT